MTKGAIAIMIVVCLIGLAIPAVNNYVFHQGHAVGRPSASLPTQQAKSSLLPASKTSSLEHPQNPKPNIRQEKKQSVTPIVGDNQLNTKKRTAEIQSALQRAGFFHDKIDGRPGPKTRKAIKDFQRAKGLVVDGVVGKQTWQELNRY